MRRPIRRRRYNQTVNTNPGNCGAIVFRPDEPVRPNDPGLIFVEEITMSEISNYKCPACTGPLRFDAATEKLVCDYCESTYDVAEIEAFYKKEVEAAEAEAAAKEKAETEELIKAAEEALRRQKEKDETFAAAFETGGNEALSEEERKLGSEEAQREVDELLRRMESDTAANGSVWGADADKMTVYNCPSCGAEIICEETTAATFCPYCGNNTIIPGKLGGATIKPDLIIPFKLEKEQAIQALKDQYKGKIFLPKRFKDKNHIEKIRGIYVPFWLFDGKAEAKVDFTATRSHIVPGHKADVAVTEHFDVHRQGTLSFEKIPTDASSQMPDDMMDSIEPFNYDEFKEFSAAYLPGFYADKYDVSIEESTDRADRRAETTVLDYMRNTVTGYESCSLVSSDVKIRHGRVEYALLPVWMLNTKWDGKDYLFAMNGQTGKMVGNLPIDKKRVAAMFFGISLPLMAIMGLISFLLF